MHVGEERRERLAHQLQICVLPLCQPPDLCHPFANPPGQHATPSLALKIRATPNLITQLDPFDPLVLILNQYRTSTRLYLVSLVPPLWPPPFALIRCRCHFASVRRYHQGGDREEEWKGGFGHHHWHLALPRHYHLAYVRFAFEPCLLASRRHYHGLALPPYYHPLPPDTVELEGDTWLRE